MYSTMNKQGFEGITYGPMFANKIRGLKEAEIVAANEWNNVCDIKYRNSNNKIDKISNVPLRILDPNSNWFPSVGDFVWVEDGNDNSPEIVAPSVDDYIVAMRERRKDKNDIMSDELVMMVSTEGYG